MKKLVLTAFAALAATQTVPAAATAREEARLIECSGVLEELFAQRDTAIPERLMARAYGVAVIPNVVKVAAVVGGRRGSGAMVVRDANGKFSDPIMVSLTGGNVGWQIGVQSTDIVLVFTSRQSIEGIVGGKVTLGADASVAAGPVGRQSSAATDVGLTAQVYSYSRAQGLFAGVALDGSAMTIDHKSNESFYGRPGVLASDIIKTDAPPAPAPSSEFIAVLQRSATGAAASTVAPRTTTAEASPAAASSSSQPSQPQSAKTYPLEDQHPGQEPPE